MKVKKARQKKAKIYRHQFDSERVEQGWFFPDRQVIRLRFPDGVLWEYQDCNMDDWEDLIKAKSTGRFLRERLDRKPYGPAKG